MCEAPLEFFGQVLPAYFTNLMIGFVLATWLGVRWAKRVGVDHDTIIDLGLYSLILGVAGSRLMHVFADGYFWDYVHLCTDPSQVSWHISQARCAQVGGSFDFGLFEGCSLEGVWDAAEGVCHPSGRDCFAWAAFWSGGLTYYGGLLAVTAFSVWFLKKEGAPRLRVADMAGMVVPLGLFWGRLGCFFGGCCFGKVTDHPFGLRFPAWSAASEHQYRAGLLPHEGLESLPVHPTQLYEALGCLAIAAGMMFWIHPRKRFDGQVILSFLASYAVLRFGLEYLRDDDRGGFLGLSTSQLVGVIVLFGVAYVWLRLADRPAAPATT